MNAANSPESGSASASESSVRVAWAGDARAIAELQIRTWQQAYAHLVPTSVIEALEPEEFGKHWRSSLTRPGDARNRVVVAVVEREPTGRESSEVLVGFAVLGPSDDPDADPISDGEIREFVVDPDHTRRGHGSRLLQASVDTLRADGFRRAVTWLLTTDDALREFLTTSGWVADGAHRELELPDDESVRLKQVRLHCGLEE